VAGRLLVRTADGVESRLVHPERALACIPNLCIHFNREANTIGSKCSDIDIARHVVDIKAEIEKIREQVQNIE
jgi:aspartyl aminopeptidase